MKKTIACTILCLSVLVTMSKADSVVPDYEIRLDTQTTESPFSIANIYAGNTTLVRAYFSTQGAAYSVTNWGSALSYGTNDSDSSSWVVVSGVNHTNYIDFQASTTDFPTNGRFFAEVILTNSTGKIQTWGQGEIIVKKSRSGSTGTLALGETINWATVQEYLNAGDGPTIGDGTTITAITNAGGQLVLSGGSGSSITVSAADGVTVTTNGSDRAIAVDSTVLRTGDAGTTTNLSDYNNDTGFLTTIVGLSNTGLVNDAGYLITGGAGSSTNLSDYENDVPFLTSFTEVDPDSLHINGDNEMAGNLNGGGQSATNFLVIAASTGTFDRVNSTIVRGGNPDSTDGSLRGRSDANIVALSLEEEMGGEAWHFGVDPDGNLQIEDGGGIVAVIIEDVTGNLAVTGELRTGNIADQGAYDLQAIDAIVTNDLVVGGNLMVSNIVVSNDLTVAGDFAMTNFFFDTSSGKMHFGPDTNYPSIERQGLTNFLFTAGANSANIGW